MARRSRSRSSDRQPRSRSSRRDDRNRYPDRSHRPERKIEEKERKQSTSDRSRSSRRSRSVDRSRHSNERRRHDHTRVVKSRERSTNRKISATERDRSPEIKSTKVRRKSYYSSSSNSSSDSDSDSDDSGSDSSSNSEKKNSKQKQSPKKSKIESAKLSHSRTESDSKKDKQINKDSVKGNLLQSIKLQKSSEKEKDGLDSGDKKIMDKCNRSILQDKRNKRDKSGESVKETLKETPSKSKNDKQKSISDSTQSVKETLKETPTKSKNDKQKSISDSTVVIKKSCNDAPDNISKNVKPESIVQEVQKQKPDKSEKITAEFTAKTILKKGADSSTSTSPVSVVLQKSHDSMSENELLRKKRLLEAELRIEEDEIRKQTEDLKKERELYRQKQRNEASKVYEMSKSKKENVKSNDPNPLKEEKENSARLDDKKINPKEESSQAETAIPSKDLAKNIERQDKVKSVSSQENVEKAEVSLTKASKVHSENLNKMNEDKHEAKVLPTHKKTDQEISTKEIKTTIVEKSNDEVLSSTKKPKSSNEQDTTENLQDIKTKSKSKKKKSKKDSDRESKKDKSKKLKGHSASVSDKETDKDSKKSSISASSINTSNVADRHEKRDPDRETKRHSTSDDKRDLRELDRSNLSEGVKDAGRESKKHSISKSQRKTEKEYETKRDTDKEANKRMEKDSKGLSESESRRDLYKESGRHSSVESRREVDKESKNKLDEHIKESIKHVSKESKPEHLREKENNKKCEALIVEEKPPSLQLETDYIKKSDKNLKHSKHSADDTYIEKHKSKKQKKSKDLDKKDDKKSDKKKHKHDDDSDKASSIKSNSEKRKLNKSPDSLPNLHSESEDDKKKTSKNYSQEYSNRSRDDRDHKRSKRFSEEKETIGPRYWDDRPSENSPSSFDRKSMKTSDTYWNKYADELGIQIEDPRDGGLSKYKDKDRRGDYMSETRKRSRSKSPPTKNMSAKTEKIEKDMPKKPVLDPLLTKTGGAYIPPAKLKMMQAQITDKSSAAYQRLAWEALKKSINGLVNKVNVSNIGIIVRELFSENVVRGRGVLCRALMQAQAFSPTFTHVYAAMVAIINTKFPQIGELLLHRLMLQFRKGIRRNEKTSCLSSCRFIAHLVNQQVAHEVIALEIISLLLEKTKSNDDETEAGEKSINDSIELAIGLWTECGMKLQELSPKGTRIISDSLRHIQQERKIDQRIGYMIEVMFAKYKDGFKDHPAVPEELDLVEDEEQFTHMIEIDKKLDSQDILNVFTHDPDYEENEIKYKDIKEGILGNDSDESGDDEGSGTDEEDSEESDDEKPQEPGEQIIDMTETNLIAFRRLIYLTIQSSLDVDECAHKLLKAEIKPGWEKELCNMILDCCAEKRSCPKFFSLLAERFCLINKVYQEPFESLFKETYDVCHRLSTDKIRNITQLFGHLLHSDAISWEVFSHIHLNQDETTSSSRVFIKLLIQVLAETLGLSRLNDRLRDSTLAGAFEGLLPRDNPVNTRFAINFFTSCGLGGLTNDLREFLRCQPKPTAVVAPVQQQQPKQLNIKDSSSSSDDSSSSSSSDSSSSSSSSDSSSSSSSDSSSSDDSSDSSSSSDSSDSSGDSRRQSRKIKKKSKKAVDSKKRKHKSGNSSKMDAKRSTSEARKHSKQNRNRQTNEESDVAEGRQRSERNAREVDRHKKQEKRRRGSSAEDHTHKYKKRRDSRSKSRDTYSSKRERTRH